MATALEEKRFFDLKKNLKKCCHTNLRGGVLEGFFKIFFTGESLSVFESGGLEGGVALYFLLRTVDESLRTVECTYSDNGAEYKGMSKRAFVSFSYDRKMGQKFTKVKRSQTNDKLERVIRVLLEMWRQKTEFTSREHGKLGFIRFVNFYNTVKPHKGIDGKAS